MATRETAGTGSANALKKSFSSKAEGEVPVTVEDGTVAKDNRANTIETYNALDLNKEKQ